MYNYSLIFFLLCNAHTRIHKVIRLVKGKAIPKRLLYAE